MWRKQANADAKLGANWQRPKGMHETTHERLMSAIWECEELRDATLVNQLAWLMLRSGTLRTDPLFRS